MEKMFYSIGEVAEMFKVNTSLIRFWEKEFDEIKPQRSMKGNRMFTQRDVDYFHQIYHLVKELGYTIQGAKDHLRQKDFTSSEKNMEILKTLKNTKAFLLLLRDAL